MKVTIVRKLFNFTNVRTKGRTLQNIRAIFLDVAQNQRMKGREQRTMGGKDLRVRKKAVESCGRACDRANPRDSFTNLLDV